MRYLIKQSTTVHLFISGSGLILPQRFETPKVSVRGLLSSLQLSWNLADWRIASNILLDQSSPLCFCCLWSHGIITSFVSDSQIRCCYCISQNICCLKSHLLNSSWCSEVHLGMFNLLTRFQLLFFFINTVNDTSISQDDWHQSGRALVIGTPFANEVIFVSKQVERLWLWEHCLLRTLSCRLLLG